MVKGGSVEDRHTFQNQVTAVAASYSLYVIITPEQTYSNCSVTRYEIARKNAADANFVIVDLYFQQIIEVNGQYSTTANVPGTQNATDPSATPNQSQGTVFTASGTPPQISSALGQVGIQ